MTDKKNDNEVELIEDIETTGPDLQVKIKKVKEDLKKCETEKKEYLDGWQRAKADYINFKNDEGKRMEDMARFLTSGLIQEILPVLDSFAALESHFRGESHPSPDERDSAIEKGVVLIHLQFEDILKKRGLERIKVEAGEEFNPEKHEAIGEMESDMPQGKIAEVVQWGYLLRDRVLRPARIRLSKGRV